jgi:hypothetical protein
MKNLNIQNPVDVTTQFFSSPQVGQTEKKHSSDHNLTVRKSVTVQDRSKTDKKGKELKRKRYNLLFVPSLFVDIEKISYVEKCSINETVNRALEFYRDTKRDILAKYAEIEKLKGSKGSRKTAHPKDMEGNIGNT